MAEQKDKPEEAPRASARRARADDAETTRNRPSQQARPDEEQPDLPAEGDGKPPEDAAPSYPRSGRSPEQAAADVSYQGGLVTGDPKPPEHPDPTMPARELTNPAGAPLLPHPGVSTRMPEAPTVSTEKQMQEFAPQDRADVEADREAGEDDSDDSEDEGDETKPKLTRAQREEKARAELNANDIKVGQIINAPRQ